MPRTRPVTVRERLSFSGSECLAQLVGEAHVVFILVDTPQGEDGSADLSNVAVVARGIGRAFSEGSREFPLIVVNKSTVSVGRILAKDILKDPAGYYVYVRNAEYPAGAIRGQLSR